MKEILLWDDLVLGRVVGFGLWVLEVDFKQILKKKINIFLGFPLRGVLPRCETYILCTLSCCDLHCFGNCLMNKDLYNNKRATKITSNYQVKENHL